MKKFSMLLILIPLLTTAVYAEEAFQTKKEKLGYAIGMNIGLNMKQQQVEADADQIVAGLRAAFQGEETLLSEEEMGEILTAYQQEMQMKQLAEMAAQAAANAESAKAFLAENAQRDGVVTLDSGLQYKEVASGDGPTPSADSQVKVNYRGTLIDGTEFDSSYKRGEPATFPVGGVIPGWTEALQLMQVGDKWELAIPPELAYGERGAPPVIPPNSALLFEVELLEIVQE